MKRSPVTDVKSSKSQAPTSREAPIRAYARYVFSVSRFHVPQGRSKIAQRFIAGLWREHKTSPVRDERTHRSSPIFSVAPTGLWPFSTGNPRLKPWATFGRPYRDFGIRACPSFNMTSATASSRREGTKHSTRGACAGPTLNTYVLESTVNSQTGMSALLR